MLDYGEAINGTEFDTDVYHSVRHAFDTLNVGDTLRKSSDREGGIAQSMCLGVKLGAYSRLQAALTRVMRQHETCLARRTQHVL